ncbi:MAG: DUF5683 domain-containing protein, partial [Gemmatimonadota bacterium]
MPTRSAFRPVTGLRALLATGALLGGCGVHATAQQPLRVPQAGPDSLRVDTVATSVGVTPGGAFLRSALVPGWGHAAIGSYKRGAFYVLVEGATAWALFKAWNRLDEARYRVRYRETLIRADLADQGVTDPAEIATALDDDATLTDLRGLEESRRQQREDWTALGLFLMLLSGADAFVSAHLSHFPAPVEVNTQ